MLGPDQRTLYTEALRPPAGYVFDEAVAATYTLDLTAVLAVPLHLVLQSASDPRELLKDSVALLEALRRVSSRLTVYCDSGRIHAPTSTNILYSLLEPVVVEVQAPRGGAFHPKFWILRFVPGDDQSESPPILRLLVLSRNLTFDRSWDICLTLEGSPGRRRLGVNREFGEFVARLPKFARRKVPAERQEQTRRLGEESRLVDWELPPGFREYRFHVLGLKRKSWRPSKCTNMAIISPFCDGAALEDLSGQSSRKTFLISRPDELEQLPPELLSNVECFFLDEAAETEDGEEATHREASDQPLVRSVGLHAKAYLCEYGGWYSRVIVGSANATSAALRRASNVELLVEMEGKTSAVGSIEELLSPERFGSLLHRFVPSDEPVPEDPERIARREAERIYSTFLESLLGADLRLRVEKTNEPSGESKLFLSGKSSPDLSHIKQLKVWPVTVHPSQAVDVSDSPDWERIQLPVKALSSMCGFLGFGVTVEAAGIEEPFRWTFVLNVPFENPPRGRNSDIVRAVISNRKGFLRYLLLLLGDLRDFAPNSALGQLLKQFGLRAQSDSPFDELPLLEHLVRAFSREPERLRSIERLVADLRKTEDGRDLLPQEFLEVWAVFQDLMHKSPEAPPLSEAGTR